MEYNADDNQHIRVHDASVTSSYMMTPTMFTCNDCGAHIVVTRSTRTLDSRIHNRNPEILNGYENNVFSKYKKVHDASVKL